MGSTRTNLVTNFAVQLLTLLSCLSINLPLAHAYCRPTYPVQTEPALYMWAVTSGGRISFLGIPGLSELEACKTYMKDWYTLINQPIEEAGLWDFPAYCPEPTRSHHHACGALLDRKFGRCADDSTYPEAFTWIKAYCLPPLPGQEGTNLTVDPVYPVGPDFNQRNGICYYCPTGSGYSLSYNLCFSRTLVSSKLSIVAKPPIIPSTSRVDPYSNYHVVTKSDLTLNLSCNEEPQAGQSVILYSDRGSMDRIAGPSQPTDVTGMTTANIETQKQPGTSTVKTSDLSLSIVTVQPAVIEWLPAEYESDFWLTCYSTELETDYKGRMRKADDYSWCGNQLPPARHYREEFMKRIYFQGSGEAKGGEIIQYESENGCYYVSKCPLTASAECAQAGTTIAVARKDIAQPVVPFKSTVDINQLGSRRAHDTGDPNRIFGHRIDVYNGSGLAVCNPPIWGNRNARVKLLAY